MISNPPLKLVDLALKHVTMQAIQREASRLQRTHGAWPDRVVVPWDLWKAIGEPVKISGLEVRVVQDAVPRRGFGEILCEYASRFEQETP